MAVVNVTMTICCIVAGVTPIMIYIVIIRQISVFFVITVSKHACVTLVFFMPINAVSVRYRP